MTAPVFGNSPIPSIEQVLPRIAEYLRAEGVLGIFRIDLRIFENVSRSFGIEPCENVVQRIASLVHELARDSVAEEEILITYGSAQDELLTFIFRPRSDHRFYQEDLPSLVEGFTLRFEKNGARMVYPFLRRAPVLPAGYSISLYNPELKLETQVYHAIELSREDAELNVRNARRRRRQHMMQIVLSESVSPLYQPIFNLHDNRMLGVEALIRGPEGTGFYRPVDMFSTAADFDLVYQLDCLCRRVALHSAAEGMLGTKIFLNCLPTAIKDPAFQGNALRERLGELDLQPSDVVLEISERESIANFSVFREIRDHYSSMGFQIAVDDVGAGHSSLESIVELSPNYLKVDMAFVREIDTDPPRQEVLRSLNHMAEKLGAHVIAEGIERQEELDMIKALGVTFGQGFLLGRPATLDGEEEEH